MINLLIDNNYPDLESDFERWDAYISAVRGSVFMPFFQPGMIGEKWDDLSPEKKENILKGFVTPHEKIFGYKARPLSVSASYGAGLWANLREIKKRGIVKVDGSITLPNADSDESLQLLICSLARNILLQNYIDGELERTELAREFKDFDTMREDAADERVRLAAFPMPSNFNHWVNRPSMRYGLQAASYVCAQLIDKRDIAHDITERLHHDFMNEQRNILAHFLILSRRKDESDLYRKLWQERAQDYVDVIIGSPEKFDSMEALYVMRVAEGKKIDIHYPKNFAKVISSSPDLKAVSILNRDEVITYTERNSASLPKLGVEARLHLLETLGPQEGLSKKQREACDLAAENLLSAWPLHESYLAHYAALFASFGEILREKEKLVQLGMEWAGGGTLDFQMAFLIELNENASRHFGVAPVPIIPFSKPMGKADANNPWRKDTAALAMEYASAAYLEKEYGIQLDPHLNGQSIIGINTHSDFGAFNSLSPMKASRYLIHEIAHHIAYKEVKDDIAGRIADNDPRLEQISEYRIIDQHAGIDRRLREEFSRAVYPLIQSEKFQYWCMDAFERSKPFRFIKDQAAPANCETPQPAV